MVDVKEHMVDLETPSGCRLCKSRGSSCMLAWTAISARPRRKPPRCSSVVLEGVALETKHGASSGSPSGLYVQGTAGRAGRGGAARPDDHERATVDDSIWSAGLILTEGILALRESAERERDWVPDVFGKLPCEFISCFAAARRPF